MWAPAGAVQLARIDWRRSRVMILSWIIAMASVSAISVSATVGLYADQAALIRAGEQLNLSQAFVALFGRIYDTGSIGAVSTIKLMLFGSVLLSGFAITLVIRHTRADEESGRGELVGSLCVARSASVSAVVAVAVLSLLVLAIATACLLAAAGLNLASASLFALSWFVAGSCFVAIASVAAQLATTSRVATLISFTALASAYLLRAIGDVSSGPLHVLVWLSPLGWSQQSRPFAGNRWWALVPGMVLTILLVILAVRRANSRDLGGGMWSERPGQRHGATWLHSPLALTWRLHRSALFAWLTGFAVFGVVLGAMATNVNQFLSSASAREFIRKLGGLHHVTDAFLAVEMKYAAIIATAFAIQSLIHLRTNESNGLSEPILTNSVSRARYLWGDGALSLAGSGVLMLVMGLSTGVAYALSSHDGIQVPRLLLASVAQLPSIWVFVGVGLAIFGLNPRLTWLTWTLFAAAVVLDELGTLLNLNHWVLDLSPFTHAPNLPGGTFAFATFVALSCLFVAFSELGIFSYRRRDIAVD